MTNEEIEKVKKEEKIEVLEDVEGNVINLDNNEELRSMGKGDESEEEVENDEE